MRRGATILDLTLCAAVESGSPLTPRSSQGSATERSAQRGLYRQGVRVRNGSGPVTIVYGAAGVGADPGRRKRGPQAGFGRRYRSEPDQGHLTVQQSHPTRLYYAAVRIPDSELSQGNSRWAGPALGWFGIQLVLSLLACGHTLLSVLSIASCTATSCDYVAFSAAINTMYIGAAVLLVASAVAMFLLRARGRAMLWMPVVGSVMVILLLVGTYVAGRAALTLPLFGNRLSG